MRSNFAQLAETTTLTATNERPRVRGSEPQQRVDVHAQSNFRLCAEVQQLCDEHPGNIHPSPRSRPT